MVMNIQDKPYRPTKTEQLVLDLFADKEIIFSFDEIYTGVQYRSVWNYCIKLEKKGILKQAYGTMSWKLNR